MGGHPARADEEIGQIERDYRTIALAKRVFGQLNIQTDADPLKIALGDKLFHDARLSSNQKVSCASCHNLETGGDSDSALTIGVSGQPTERNAPTVYNLIGHVAYFWDGRAKTLADQMDGPVHNPDELGSTWPEIVRRVSGDETYRIEFDDAFGSVPSEATIKAAIVDFQKSLMTPDTPFDRFLDGDLLAMSAQAKRGLNTFVDLGCASCHQGNLVGANLMQEFGVFRKADGFASVERYKVPSLRNVAFTAPYFHDGHEPTLEGAISKMASIQLGYQIGDQEKADIVAFLNSLSSDRLTARSRQGVSIAANLD